MKCECSLNNNYEIIGPCDIKKFNSRINEFNDNSWTQLTIPEKFELSTDKPPIKNITEVYLDIEITSTKIIKTPSSNIPNVQGLTLTGKILLVSGSIHQNVIYGSETLSNSMHSIKFENSFTTYIVLEENTNIEIDNYCVYPCVEDISVTTLNERTLNKNITVFLFAHKITKLLPEIQKLPNSFIFKTSDTDEEMAKIEFDVTNKKLIVTSTGESYNNPISSNKEVFLFILANLSTTGSRVSSTIKGTENADRFKSELNDKSFDFNDVITLVFLHNPKVLLTNYINLGDNYSMLSKDAQSFKITPTGIIPYVLPNQIMLKGKNDIPVVVVEFDIFATKLLVNSTGNATNDGGPNYFKMTLLQADGTTEIISSTISGNSNGNNFKTILNSQDLVFNGVIRLEYEDSSKVLISNFPNSSTPIYNLKGNREEFKITATELVAHRLVPPPIKLSNDFLFKTFDRDEEMGKVEFDVANKKLIVTSTGKIYNDPPATGRDVFIFSLINFTLGNPKISTIKGTENADNFKTELNGENFDFGDVVSLTFKDNSKVLLTNCPIMGRNYSMKSKYLQSFEITPNGIVPSVFPIQIILNGKFNNPVIIVKFDVLTRKILVTSSASITGDGGANYFKMTLFASDGTTEKISSTIPANTRGTAFETSFNNQSFSFLDIIKLEYEDNSKVVITNFPDSNTPFYNPSGDSELFMLTKNGLAPKLVKLPNAFIFKTSDTDEEMAKIEFDANNKKLVVTSTGKNYNRPSATGRDVFIFTINNFINSFWSSTIKGTENANNFKNYFNDKLFDFGDMITLSFIDNSKVLLSNYPSMGDNYSMPSSINTQNFQITPTGITPYVFPNEIILNDANNYPVIIVKFDIDIGKIVVNSTGNITSDGSPNYFKMTLLHHNASAEIISSTISGNSNGDSFKAAFNDKNLRFDFSIKLECENVNKVTITNFPNSNTPAYNLTETKQVFDITPFGLLTKDMKLSDAFLFKAFDTDEEIAKIQFDLLYKRLVVTSTGKNYNKPSSGNVDVFTFTLIDNISTGTSTTASIKGTQNANDFKNKLNNLPFDITSSATVILTFLDKPKVSLKNHPILSNDKQSFRITDNGLVPFLLQNQIILSNAGRQQIVTILFDIIARRILITSTGNVTDNGGQDYFKVTLLEADGRTEKFSSSIAGNSNGNNFRNIFNSTEFSFNDVLKLEYKDNTKVLITKFSSSYPTDYTPTRTSELFKITSARLLKFRP